MPKRSGTYGIGQGDLLLALAVKPKLITRFLQQVAYDYLVTVILTRILTRTDTKKYSNYNNVWNRR